MRRHDSGNEQSDTALNVKSTKRESGAAVRSEEISDITVDESMYQSIERELTEVGSENLLKGRVRTQ